VACPVRSPKMAAETLTALATLWRDSICCLSDSCMSTSLAHVGSRLGLYFTQQSFLLLRGVHERDTPIWAQDAEEDVHVALRCILVWVGRGGGRLKATFASVSYCGACTLRSWCGLSWSETDESRVPGMLWN
jgi:hypothetical protein